MFRVAASLVMVAVAGCADVSGQQPDESTVAQAICETEGCPGNSPVIATFPFIDLSLRRFEPNAQGISITRFMINGLDHQLRVTRGQISGVRTGPPVTGNALEGAELWLRHSDKDGDTERVTEYVLKITSVARVPMWANRNPSQPAPEIEAYHIDWTDVVNHLPSDHPWQNLCAAAMLPGGGGHYDPDLRGVRNDLTFVFEGDRINPNTRVVYDLDTNWFNLGCSGHTLMKMYLMGHVEATQLLGYVTTRDERTTIMKMFSADYCGTGYAFTVPGMKLQWQDHKHWFNYPGLPLRIEARWGPNGATCLNVPRVDANPTSASDARWPRPGGVAAAIPVPCRLTRPACTNTDIQFFDNKHLVTATP
jgi:hypothetical protein